MAKGHLRLKKKYKILLIILLFVLVLGIGVVLLRSLTAKQPEPQPIQYGDIKDISVSEDEEGYFAVEKDDSILTFMIIDVGQGQSIFIDYQDYEVLIDAGSYNDGSTTVVDTIKPYVDGNLDTVIATHGHEDHIGGFSTVFKNFTIDNVIYGEKDTSTTWGAIFFKNAEKATSCVEDSNNPIVLGKDVTLSIFDVADNMEYSNANSVVCLLTYGDTTFFMSGDLEEEQELLLRNESSIRNVDVVVAGHHGSETSNTLLDILRPNYLLVSCGKNNEYHYPHQSFLKKADKYSTYCYATFRSGTLVFESNGEKVTPVNDFN